MVVRMNLFMSYIYIIYNVWLKFFDLYVLEPYFIAVVLEEDTSVAIAEIGPVFVFAVCHECVPLLCASFVFYEFYAVEPMFYMVILDDNGCGIPCCDVEWLLFGSGNEVVE